MAPRSSTTQQGTVNGPAWSKNNTSDFEYDSPPDSFYSSSGYESMVSEDLDLYKPSTQEVLTGKQINTLDRCVGEFRAADYETREQIVEEVLDSFKSGCPRGVKLDEVSVRTLIRQYLYGKVKPVMEKSAPKTRSRVVEESKEIALTNAHISILENLVTRFRTSKVKRREKIIKEAADHIKSMWAEDVEFDRDAVTSLIREYLYGKIKKGWKKSMFETRKWSYYGVLTAMHRKKISKLTTKLSQNSPGSRNYLRYYTKARAVVEKGLTENQRRKYKAMAKTWSENKLPPELQRRMMAQRGPSAIKEFTSSVYSQFGMRIVILAAFADSDGDPSMTLFDYNDKNGGKSFKESHKNWRQYRMVEDFSKWSAESIGVLQADGSDDEAERKQTAPEIKLKRNKHGYPVLPSLEDISGYGLQYKKRLIGKFVGDIYRNSIGAPKARVPWAKIQKSQGKYIKKRYLPEQVTLQQYYHICLEDVNAILEHWVQRQSAGKVPFCFKEEAEAALQDNCASKENDVNADMEPGEAAEEDLQDDGRCQELGDRASQEDGGSGDSTEQAHPGQSLGDAAENPSRHLPCPPNDGQLAATQPRGSAAADAQQQTGGGMASHSHPIHPPQTPSRPHSLDCTLNGGSGAGQTGGASAEDGPGSAGQNPSPDRECLKVQSDARNEELPQPDPPRAADEGEQPPPGSLRAASEDEQLPPGSLRAADEDEQSPPGSPGAPDDDERPSAAFPSPTNERLQLQPESGSASPETRGRRCGRRKNGGPAADSPSSKRRKVDRQGDGASLSTRRSKRARRPTTKATKER